MNEKQLQRDVRKGYITNKLIEIGPRFVMQPIRIFSGSFTGQTLFQNNEYVSPNIARAIEKKRKGTVYANRVQARVNREGRAGELTMEKDVVDDVFRD